ncbi:MAG: glycosyltransferase, partial [Chlorobi bacterium]|nr:glycosyltransferase [Chlorobiota bacterium]
IYTLFRRAIDYFTIKFLTNEDKGRFSFPLFGKNISKNKFLKEADIIHLHWINEGFFSLKTFRQLQKLNKPIVWTLHDMWAFTGGCHYDNGCGNFTTRCANCPSLKIKGENDFSSTIFARKLLLYQSAKFHVITCSDWLARTARESVLFEDMEITPIPNPINANIFKPLDKATAKNRFNLTSGKIHILFVTMTVKEKRKGFHLLKEALLMLNKNSPELRDRIELVVMGAADENEINKLPFPVKTLGRLSSVDDIVGGYNAADVFVAPSLQDNLPNTVMEALACGTPVVAFNVGGIPEMVEHKVSGYLAEELSVKDLADGIALLAENKNMRDEFSKAGREKVLRDFAEEVVAERFISYYKRILKKV